MTDEERRERTMQLDEQSLAEFRRGNEQQAVLHAATMAARVVEVRACLMAQLLTGWLSDMEGDAAKRNVAHARKTADAIMEAAR